MFTDELWANGGAHTTSYVTVNEDGSDRYLPECLQHKYRKGAGLDAPWDNCEWEERSCLVLGKGVEEYQFC